MQLDENFPDGLLERSVEIGAVTDRSVRVWVRWPGVSSVGGVVLIAGEEVAHATAAVSRETDWTGVLQFELPEPAPGAAFKVKVNGEESRAARLAPAPGQSSGLTFGFGSCNRPFKPGDGRVDYHQAAGIYDSLADDLQRADASLFLLAGDQIYSDGIDSISVRAGHVDDPDWLPTQEESVEAYRRVTRGYLGVPGFLKLREQFPTLTIWDDHDIFDNWGSRKDVSALDFRLFESAMKVYNEYQHARNPVSHRGQPPFYYYHRYGDIGFYVLDIRSERDWQSGKLLGSEQWNDFVGLLEGSDSDEISTLFIVSSVPVAHVARWMAELLEPVPGKLGDSVRDRWSTRAFRPQRNALFEELLKWRNAAPGRQVIVLSGDVHVAGAFTIRPRTGPGKIEQFTSSAFTTPLSSFEQYLNVFASRGSNLFEPSWRFTRHFVSYANNAGLVRLTPLESGGHHVELLIRGWNLRERTLHTVARYSSTPGDS